PLLQASLRFYPDAAAAGRLGPFRRLMIRRLAAALAVLLGVLALGVAVYDAKGLGTITVWATIAVAALLVADTARMFESGLLNAARRQRAFSLWSLLDAWARPAGAVVAVLVLSASGTGVIAGTCAGCVLAALPFLRLREAAEGREDDAWQSRLS